MSNTELLMEKIRTLPANFVEEVLQFIEHLKHENTSANQTLPSAYSPEDALKVSSQKKSTHGREPISRYCGRLKSSKAFAGDPLEIQQQMRSEWNRD